MTALDYDSLRAFVGQIAALTADGDEVEGGDEFVMENDDAWSTINRLIHEAREMVGLEDETP